MDQWREGERRLRAAPPHQRRALERVYVAIFFELRRRLGGAFYAEELVALYDRGTAWCMAIAVAQVPDAPWAWEAWLADASFQRYLREARDYAGGRLSA